MTTTTNEVPTDQIKSTALGEQLWRALNPTEEDVYQRWMERQFWSIDEFSALIAGLTPENYKIGAKGSMKCSDAVFLHRNTHATDVFTLILDDIDKNPSKRRDFRLGDKALFMSAWKFIKWVAEHDIRMSKRFFDAIPLILLELYIEFQPLNSDLRTAHISSRRYHKASYLKQAQELLEDFPSLTPTEVYFHPRMQNALDYIRHLGGKYKKRTIIESWLPEIINSPPHRPRKYKC